MLFFKTWRCHFKHFIMLLTLVLTTFSAIGQVKPPAPMSVSNSQSLNFGVFSQPDDLGGTLTFSSTGVRSTTGNIYTIGSSGYYAIFTVTSVPGTQIVLLNEPAFILTGSNGGSIVLHIGSPYPTCPYTTTSTSTQIQIGGTLTIGSRSANPPGSYSGTFAVTFNNE